MEFSAMALPKAYLTSTKNLQDILTSIQQAQAPKQFSTNFLIGLGHKSSSDRLIIGVLKALGFLTEAGAPTPRYFEYLDQTQSDRVLADAIRDAYADLFELNINAQTMTKEQVKGKFKTLTQGQFSDDVLGKMASTFVALSGHADFDAVAPADTPKVEQVSEDRRGDVDDTSSSRDRTQTTSRSLGGLVYNIQIQLPESRDPAVYDALFRSLKLHLLDD
jgi:hypothetical protein